MNRNLALIGLGAVGLVLALGRRSQGSGPPSPIILNPARFFTEMEREAVDLIILRTAEMDDIKDGAITLGNYFADEPEPPTSAHYITDETMIVQSVDEKDMAWAYDSETIDPVAIHIEVVALAGKGGEGWADIYTQGALDNAAWLVARAARRWDIPLTTLDTDMLETVDKPRGIIAEPDFPVEAFLAMVKKYR